MYSTNHPQSSYHTTLTAPVTGPSAAVHRSSTLRRQLAVAEHRLSSAVRGEFRMQHEPMERATVCRQTSLADRASLRQSESREASRRATRPLR
jgi:hypothetical protein